MAEKPVSAPLTRISPPTGADPNIGSLEVALEGRQREAANDNAGTPLEHSVGLRVTARW